MITIQDRTSIATPAHRRKPPPEQRFTSHRATSVRYQNRLPARRHPGPRKEDLRAVHDHRAANALSSKRIAPVQIPIAPRRC